MSDRQPLGDGHHRQRVRATTSSGLESAKSSISPRRTASIASNSGSPIASRSMSLASNLRSPQTATAAAWRCPAGAVRPSPNAAGSPATSSGSDAGAGQAGRQQRADHQIRVGGQVEALDLKVGPDVLLAGRAGDQAQSGLPVLPAPDLVDTGPVGRHQPNIAGHARRADGYQRGQRPEDPGGERLALVGHVVPT